MKKNTIEITIYLIDDKNGAIDLDVCTQKLSSLGKVLKEAANKISSKEPVTLKLVKAQKNSPLTASIECQNYSNPSNGERVISQIKKSLKAIKEGVADINTLGFDFIQTCKDLSKISNKKNNKHETKLSFPNNETIFLDEDFARTIDKLLEGDESCISSYEGALDQINVHNEINYFFIYPYSSPQKIKCTFPDKLRDTAIDGIGRKVCITGEAIYGKNQDFPHLIKVTEIDVYPSENDLPNWDDLLGIAPDATGDLSSEDFVRKLRNEW